MAAAEYFSNVPMTQSSFQQPQNIPNPSLQQESAQTRPHIPQSQPPPYTERPGVSFAPPPTEYHQRHSFSGQQRPSFSSPQTTWSQPSQQVHHAYTPPQQPQRPYYQPAYGTPPQKTQHLAPHMRPYANPNSSQFSLDSGGYSSDPEPHRRRHKHRKSRDDGETRSKSGRPHSRSTNADAFVGAAGIGLLGDAILPGLGTIGGAALGWIGGKDYGNHRKQREEKREREQRDWEDRYRKHRRSRSRSHSHGRDHRSRSRASTLLGERRDSYERRPSHH